jgi:FtsZ-binding cell division protein ZapB
MKITKRIQERLEELLELAGFKVRYEKGNFKGGYCVLDHQNLVMINKFYTLEGKVNVLIDVLNSVNLDMEKLTEEQKKLVKEVQKMNDLKAQLNLNIDNLS